MGNIQPGGISPQQPTNQPIPPANVQGQSQSHVSDSSQAQNTVQGQADAPTTFAGALASGNYAQASQFKALLQKELGTVLGDKAFENVMVGADVSKQTGKAFTGLTINEIIYATVKKEQEAVGEETLKSVEDALVAGEFISAEDAHQSGYTPPGVLNQIGNNFDKIEYLFSLISIKQQGDIQRGRIEDMASDKRLAEQMAELNKINEKEAKSAAEESTGTLRNRGRRLDNQV